MNLGDAISEVKNLYKQCEALAALCKLDTRKYERQYLSCCADLAAAIKEFADEPQHMMLLISELSKPQ